MKTRKMVSSLCPESDREYYKVAKTPIQISAYLDEVGLFKIQLKKSRVRIESNRIVFELTPEALKELVTVGRITLMDC
jgi:hypothetical protein